MTAHSSIRTVFARRALVLLATLVGVLWMAGCGGSDSSDGENATAQAGGEKAAASAPTWTGLGDPLAGSVPERTNYVPGDGKGIEPPLRKAWTLDSGDTLEFPVVAKGVAYFLDPTGQLKAVRLRDRKTLWARLIYPGKLPSEVSPIAPAYGNGYLLIAFTDGVMIEIDPATGKPVWEYDLHIPLSTPPVLIGKRIYVETQEVNVIAQQLKTGLFAWGYSGIGLTKAPPSVHKGRVFTANTKGSVMSVAGAQLLWRTNTNKKGSKGKAGFYSSPAIAFGQVYVPRADGVVFALDEKSGDVAWTFRAAGRIDGSLAVAEVPGTPPTVYVGSADGYLYAIDALSGQRLWRHKVGSPLSGAPIVVDDTVYVSSSTTGKTVGVDVHTQRPTFELSDNGGAQTVSDGQGLYAASNTELLGLQPGQQR